MQYVSSITTKGQVVIPAIIRKKNNLKPKDKIIFVDTGKKIYIEKVPAAASLFGKLHNSKIKPLTTKQMNDLVTKKMFS